VGHSGITSIDAAWTSAPSSRARSSCARCLALVVGRARRVEPESIRLGPRNLALLQAPARRLRALRRDRAEVAQQPRLLLRRSKIEERGAHCGALHAQLLRDIAACGRVQGLGLLLAQARFVAPLHELLQARGAVDGLVAQAPAPDAGRGVHVGNAQGEVRIGSLAGDAYVRGGRI